MTIIIHQIPPTLYCVPACLYALTGEPLDAVVVPALNRHGSRGALLADPGPSTMRAAESALVELGYRVFRRKGLASERRQLRTWAREYASSEDAFLVSVPGHALILRQDKVYDTIAPDGCPAELHPHAKRTVDYLAIVRRRAD